jgi:hypothetical protein
MQQQRADAESSDSDSRYEVALLNISAAAVYKAVEIGRAKAWF